MAKESEAPIRFPSAEIVRALLREGNRVKEETSSLAGRFGDRVKTHQETGNLHGPSFRQAGAIYRKAQNNEIKAREHIAHLRYLLDLIEGDLDNRGHVGDLDRMSKAAAEKEEPQSAAAAAEAIFKKLDADTEANRAAFREKFDIPAEGVEAPAPEAVAAKPTRGRKAKTPEATAEAAPPPPPPALKDDDEEEPSPTPRRVRAAGTATAIH